MKKCTKCKESKNLEDFGKNSRAKDLKQTQCKNCLRQQDLENSKNRPLHEKPKDGVKKCSKCTMEKHVDEFYLNPRLSMGVHSECIKCTTEKVSKWAKDNPDKMAINGKKYRETHKTEEQLRARKYVELNKEERKKYNLTWNQQNKDRINQTARERRKEDHLYRMKSVTRCLIKDAFIRACKGEFPKKNRKSEVVIGCLFSEFLIKIESQFLDWMSWDNQGFCPDDTYSCTWHIDHIIPISYAKTEEEIYMLNHWSNLQPLCGKKNLEKLATVYPCTNLELGITFWEDSWEYISTKK